MRPNTSKTENPRQSSSHGSIIRSTHTDLLWADPYLLTWSGTRVTLGPGDTKALVPTA